MPKKRKVCSPQKYRFMNFVFKMHLRFKRLMASRIMQDIIRLVRELP